MRSVLRELSPSGAQLYSAVTLTFQGYGAPMKVILKRDDLQLEYREMAVADLQLYRTQLSPDFIACKQAVKLSETPLRYH